ncbi:MAG: dTMP kinase [Candidatus Poseidoniaceae archaeon]|nr:dTMP kinase [Candidatus Poseidoniaceae archaeon]
MYLISVEGGDGSGKGEAARIIGEILNDFPFPKIYSTHEPRRHSELGKLALESVMKGDKTPLQEAGLFAADRLDHSHTIIKPLLEKGQVVVSDRNIHSSMIYQGIVGDLGIEDVVKMNAAAMIPDLVIWIDCDPAKAMKRIQSGTLRMTSNKQEYFETTEIQKQIRKGFRDLLSGKISVPEPFDKCQVVGPILNESGLDELKKKLSDTLRTFFNKKPAPLNVDSDKVDRYLLSKMVSNLETQTRLPGAPKNMTAIHEGWLANISPAKWMEFAENNWPKKSAKEFDVPINPFSLSSWSILGSLSIIGGSTEVPKLHKLLGPHRMITRRHTQRLVKWLEEEKWINKQFNHVPFSDAKVFKLREERLGFGRLALAMWPLRTSISSWRRANPESEWEFCLEEIIQNNPAKLPAYQLKKCVGDVIGRLVILTSGHLECPVPSSTEELIVWWKTLPP